MGGWKMAIPRYRKKQRGSMDFYQRPVGFQTQTKQIRGRIF
jgi:hypothetical protein